ncbi:MAG: 5'(3')-deoxyribonucleotidase [Bacteroidota bacterium]|nr:5'(3')-deoxyribonucleotidase [Bacteroidota bacterium]
MKQPVKKTIAIDMDGVIADVEPQLIKYYEQLYGIITTREAIQGLSGAEAFPQDAFTKSMLKTPGFFRTLTVMPGAVAAVKRLTENYAVYIVSAAIEFPTSLFEKIEWLKEHFPFIGWRNITLCGDKSIIHTDYLIDDHCKNLDFCNGKAIMFNAHHNQNDHQHLRVYNWEEILTLFENEGQVYWHS